MEEEEALRNYCRVMISRVRNKQQSVPEPRRRKHGAARGSNWSESERQVASEHRGSNLPVLEPNRDPTSPNVGQGPAVPPVPFQLITMLRIKALKEEMRRAAQVELHGPAVCNMCAQEQASLALQTFIRRKKTQLQLQTLKGRLNTAWDWTLQGGVGAKKKEKKSPKALQCPSLDLGGTTWQRNAGHSNLGLP